MNQTEKISGVFSTQDIQKVGTGTTTRKSIRKAFWFCVEIDSGEQAGSIEVQPLNVNYVPSGPKKLIDREKFLSDFAPEPEFYQATVFPRIREITKTVARGERYRNNGELYSAEMEFNNALNLDVENIRATFGLGLTYIARGENAKAENILERIVKMDEAFEPEYKHLYNEFGIQLRKGKMTPKAIAYYKRALELSSQDEHLYYNIARAYLDNKEPGVALEFLCKALELNPGFVEASQFLLWLFSKNVLPEAKKQELTAVLNKARETVAKAAAPAADPSPQPADSAAGVKPPPAPDNGQS